MNKHQFRQYPSSILHLLFYLFVHNNGYNITKKKQMNGAKKSIQKIQAKIMPEITTLLKLLFLMILK